ncbi:MAG: hypothetical protein ACRD26_00700 [Vicinamibacterales bacterium]
MRRIGLLLLAAAVAGCSRNIEVEKALKVTDVHTGWYDAGIQADGKNKLVPSVSLRLQNVYGEPVRSVQINAIFRRVGEQEAWGEHFVRAIGPDGLPPGATGNLIVLRSNLGYTGTQPRMQMLENREFIDAKVEIYGKQGSRTWIKLGEYQIDRQLLTQ